MVAGAACPGLKTRRVLEEEPVEEIATIQVNGLAQTARGDSCHFFEDLCIKPEGRAGFQFELIRVANNPFHTCIETTQESTYFSKQCFKSAASTLFIYFPTKKREQALSWLWSLSTDQVVEQRARTTAWNFNQLILIANLWRPQEPEYDLLHKINPCNCIFKRKWWTVKYSWRIANTNASMDV